MGFEQLDLPITLNTSRRDPIEDLFVPLLRESTEYCTAVGYFSSAWIRDAAPGIAALASNGGKAKWVLGHQLSQADWNLLEGAYSGNEKAFADKLTLESLDELTRALATKTRDTIAWLVRDGILEFKIAIPQDKLRGIFHAKIGVFRDSAGNRVAFTGSYNLTGAADTNWETIEVFSSLRKGDEERVRLKEREFKRIWQRKDPNLRLYRPSAEAVKPLIEIANRRPRPYLKPSQQESRQLRVPEWFTDAAGDLRRHQEDAIDAWFKNRGRGIFNMATGSGKTVTALAALTRFANRLGGRKEAQLLIVITVPFRHLAEQWREEALPFGFQPVMCYGDYPNWPTTYLEKLNDLKSGIAEHLMAITVNRSFSMDRFQQFMADHSGLVVFVADEMHNLGAASQLKALPDNARFRLGLSATPIRHGDDEGTEALRNYFGPDVITYGLEEALRDGHLTPYYYYPIITELTSKETIEFYELSQKIGRLMAQRKDKGLSPDDQHLKALLIRRARLTSCAENKTVALKGQLLKRRDSQFNLIYAGDKSTNDERHVMRILSMVGGDVGMRAQKFTAEENITERKKILSEFGAGQLQALVAIRCLDEGVDVPRTESAYILASSTNPRQFIQRRGRVLRKAKGKQFANIYDFIAIPGENSQLEHQFSSSYTATRNYVKRELERVGEFALLAQNHGVALRALRPLRREYGLFDI